MYIHFGYWTILWPFFTYFVSCNDHFNVSIWGTIMKDIHHYFIIWRILWLRSSTQQYKLQSIFRTLLIFLCICQRNRGLTYTIITSIGSLLPFLGLGFILWNHFWDTVQGWFFWINESQRFSACLNKTKQISKGLHLDFLSKITVENTCDFLQTPVLRKYTGYLVHRTSTIGKQVL
jgi:hypothetical protein